MDKTKLKTYQSEGEKNAIQEIEKVLLNVLHKKHEDTSPYDLAEALCDEGYRKQEWISVDERLPDNRRVVLIACKGTTIGGAAPIAIGSYCGGFWLIADADGTAYLTKYMHIVVTHWMPLPEQPKGE